MRCFLGLSLIFLGCRTVDKGFDTGGLGDGGDAQVDVDGDGFSAAEDCDDNDASVFPGATEVCDGVDNNCENGVDEGVASTWYTDEDGDGFGNPYDSSEACDQPAGAVPSGTDCDDADPDVYPSAPEVCNGLDDNCDGQSDEGLSSRWYPDDDADGFGDTERGEDLCDTPLGWVQVAGDCDDGDMSVFPGAAEVCDEVDQDCDGAVDEDVATVFWFDVDGDGYGDDDITIEACSQPSGYAEVGGDCDDTNFDVYPSAPEYCNGRDDDCDGVTDEDDSRDATSWYLDADGDGYGVAATTMTACDQPSGYVALTATFDCDDADPTTNPAALEYCDGEDDDCDGSVDESDAVDASTWYIDVDSDGYGSPAYTLDQCTQPSGYVSDATDCDDLDSSISPGATEICNDVDDDCNGTADDGLATSTWYADSDGDGYGDSSVSTVDCAQPSGTVWNATDCDDTDPAVSPGGTEICNGVDDDCDGLTDDDDTVFSGTSTWYADADSDGYGDASVTTTACQEPSGYTADATDCDDGDAAISPAGTETCNDADDNCDGQVDENLLGVSVSCPAVSCAEILDSWSTATDGDYVLDPDGSGQEIYACDMTTDGGGWTEVVYWDRVNDGDDKADLLSHFDVLLNNMGTMTNQSTAVYWQDNNATADVLSLEREVLVPNDGDVLYEIQYTGNSMEQSAAFFWAEAGGSDTNLECWNGATSWSPYNSTERAQRPGYTCTTGWALTGGSRTVSWTGFVQDDVGADIEALHFASFHYDSCCDYSYLYRFEAWVR